jgi:DNA-binding beta-propeller fold protein YncE
MKKRLLLATLLAGTAHAQTYHLAKTIPLPGPAHWDYVHYEAAENRIYISQFSQMDVLNALTGVLIGRVTGLNGSHGVAIDTATGLGYADSGKSRTISVFDLKTLKTLKTIPALADADGMVFDPVSNQVFNVGGDAQAMLAIKATTNQEKTIPLGGSPEFLVTDNAGALYININSTGEMVKLDTKTDTITARWKLGACDAPVGLAIDTATHRLFASCDNATLVVVNADTGALVATLPIGKGTDSDAFDPAKKLIFSSNRDGTLSVIQEVSANKFVALPPVKTALGARTLAVNTASGDIFLVTAHVTAIGAPKHPGGADSLTFAPGTLRALIYAQAKN